MEAMWVFAYYILAIPGYLDVDGKHFHTKEECRAYAIARYKDFPLEELPDHWTCLAVKEKKLLPFIDREVNTQ